LSYVPRSRYATAPSSGSGGRSGRLPPEVGLGLGRTLTLDEDQSNQADEQ